MSSPPKNAVGPPSDFKTSGRSQSSSALIVKVFPDCQESCLDYIDRSGKEQGESFRRIDSAGKGASLSAIRFYWDFRYPIDDGKLVSIYASGYTPVKALKGDLEGATVKIYAGDADHDGQVTMGDLLKTQVMSLSGAEQEQFLVAHPDLARVFYKYQYEWQTDFNEDMVTDGRDIEIARANLGKKCEIIKQQT